MIASDLKDLWIPGALILGFQTTAFKWRIDRELKFAEKKMKTWLPPCEWIGLAGMLIVLAGVFLLPMGNQIGLPAARFALVLGTLCLVAQVLGLCGHYRLFTGGSYTGKWYNWEEVTALATVSLLGVAYFVTAKTDPAQAEPVACSCTVAQLPRTSR